MVALKITYHWAKNSAPPPPHDDIFQITSLHVSEGRTREKLSLVKYNVVFDAHDNHNKKTQRCLTVLRAMVAAVVSAVVAAQFAAIVVPKNAHRTHNSGAMGL